MTKRQKTIAEVYHRLETNYASKGVEWLHTMTVEVLRQVHRIEADADEIADAIFEEALWEAVA